MANGKKKQIKQWKKGRDTPGPGKKNVDPTESMIVLSGQLQFLWDQALVNGGLRWQPTKACEACDKLS